MSVVNVRVIKFSYYTYLKLLTTYYLLDLTCAHFSISKIIPSLVISLENVASF